MLLPPDSWLRATTVPSHARHQPGELLRHEVLALVAAEHPSRQAPKVSVHETGPSTGKVMSLVTFDVRSGSGKPNAACAVGPSASSGSRIERGTGEQRQPQSCGTGEHERPAGEPAREGGRHG